MLENMEADRPMNLEDEVELLRQVPLFAQVEPSKLKLLAFTSDHVCFQAGETLMRESEAGTAAYIILEGQADVLVNTLYGPLAIAQLGRNDIVGEIALLCDMPRTATVRARTALVTLCISKDLFFQLLAEFPHIAVEMMRELARRLDRTSRQLSASANRVVMGAE